MTMALEKLSDLFRYCAWDAQYQDVGHDVSYAFVEEGRKLWIFFQGSNGVFDWVRNFLFRKKPYKDMEIEYKVHRGFLAAWKEVEDIVIEKVTERENFGQWRYKYEDITIIGYSHGGALAGFCHECVWFHREDLREKGLRSFGFEAPHFYGGFKVNPQLKERWEKFLVIRCGNDIVTHCPPWLFGYCHVGDMMRLQCDPSIVEKNIPNCVKCHYPEVVYQALLEWEQARESVNGD